MHTIRKTTILLSVLLILQLNLSCKTQEATIALKNNFTTEQIVDLNRIIDFFKSEICVYQKDDFKTCFLQIPFKFTETSNNSFWTTINFEEQKRLYQQISESTFDEIWGFCKSTYFPSQTTAMDIFAITNGKYQKYLSDLAKTNPRVAEYLKRIEASGDFNNFDIQYEQILSDKKYFDLKDKNTQLIIAIHYLSMNDQFKRNAHLMNQKRP